MMTQDKKMWDKRIAVESRRGEAIRKAVDAANRVVMDASDGSVVETNYLIAKVAGKMMLEALLPHYAAMMRADQENMQVALGERESGGDVTVHNESSRQED